MFLHKIFIKNTLTTLRKHGGGVESILIRRTPYITFSLYPDTLITCKIASK